MSASRSRVLVWRSLICSISIVSSSCRIYPCTLHAPQRNARRFSRKVLRVHRSPAAEFTHRRPFKDTRDYSIRCASQISTADRTHARTGPDTQRAQAHNHTQNSNSRTQPDKPHVHTHTHTSRGERCPSTDDTAPHHSHTHSATPTRERTRQWNHRLRELHRPLRQRLRPLPRPLLLHLSMHLPLSPNLVELAAPWPSGVRRALTSGTRPAIAKAE